MKGREAMESEFEKVQQTKHKLLSFQLTNDYVGVFAEEVSRGVFELVPRSIQAIGLAESTTTYFERLKKDHRNKREYRKPDVWVQVVTLWLFDGEWEICESFDNFAGVCKIGDDITKATGHLQYEYRLKIKCLQPAD